MAKRTIHMVFSKETKRTRVYVADTVGVMPIIPTIYIEKWFVGEAKEIEITVVTDPHKVVVKEDGSGGTDEAHFSPPSC